MNQHSPEISVIMPVYNGAAFIRQTIDSVLAQTFQDFEFIIIDDCSTDSSAGIVASHQDPRIRFLKNEHNLGISETTNRGIKEARGEFIVRGFG